MKKIVVDMQNFLFADTEYTRQRLECVEAADDGG